MTARFIIGDTRDVTATLPDGSVDLVIPEQVVAQCEIDPTARAVLARHWPEAEDYGDGEDA